ncbi:Alpha-ketoglutarate permease [Streptomyces hundungensis]|uniref:Alpha-ketoglutarate permease n=2 Tax=Streptomyces hundungensis TaxID=1077946 RepID=A0A387HDW5_9ACTN|nr:Alpha-ketoglutarate permease [Streptomyces hundungensis]
MVELFPLGARGIGVGLPYAATVAAFGGTAPYVSMRMDGHGPKATFPVYVALLCVLTFAVAWRTLDRGRGRAAPGAAPHAERLSMP